MTDTIRNLEDIINKLDSYIKINEGKIQALEKIEFPTKKDGSAFSVFSKNFTNCRIENDGINAHNTKLTYFYNDGVRTYNEDWINLYLFIDEMAKDDPRREQANPHESLLRDTYSLTVEETRQAIQERIKHCQDNIAEYEVQKLKAQSQYNFIKNKVEELHKAIADLKNSDIKKPDTLYYSFCELAEYGVKWGLKD